MRNKKKFEIFTKSQPNTTRREKKQLGEEQLYRVVDGQGENKEFICLVAARAQQRFVCVDRVVNPQVRQSI